MFGECHGHIFMDGNNYRQARALHSFGVNETDVRRKLELYRAMGISFFRDGGDDLGVSEFATGIAGEYGIDYRTPIYAIHKNGCYGSIVGRGFDTMQEYRQLVRGVDRRGGDFIKVMFSGIMDFGTDGHITGQPLEKGEIREMIHIAHEEGFSVMAHVNGAQTIFDAAECGVDSIEHGNFMEEECLHAMRENRTVWVPTISTIYNLLGRGRFDDGVIRKLYERQKEYLLRAWEAGVYIALGSDAGAWQVYHAQGTADEYRRFLEIFGKTGQLEERLHDSEQIIRDKFRRKM